jgi:carbonic anhydrase
MAARVALAIFSLASTIIACPDHEFHSSGSALQKRAAGQDWAYEASYNWGMINESM